MAESPVRRDYPTEWQLLWVQGWLSPNKNDYQVKTEPEVFHSRRFCGFHRLSLNGHGHLKNPLYFRGF